MDEAPYYRKKRAEHASHADGILSKKVKDILDILTVVGIWFAGGVAVWAISSSAGDSAIQQEVLKGQLSEMLADRRPWLAAGVSIDRDLFFSEWGGNKQMQVNLIVTLQNFGRSPATNIQISAHLNPSPQGTLANLRQLQSDQAQSCNEARQQSLITPIKGRTIFPGDPPQEDRNHGLGAIWLPTTYWISGCVDYTYGNAQHGQTVFQATLGLVEDGVWAPIPFPEDRQICDSPAPKPPGWPKAIPTCARIPANQVDIVAFSPRGTIIN